jgi:hypothetical protein
MIGRAAQPGTVGQRRVRFSCDQRNGVISNSIQARNASVMAT